MVGAIWDETFGPLLFEEEARSILGQVESADLDEFVRNGEVLRLEDDLGQVRYPRWQFDTKAARPYPLIKEVSIPFRFCGADDWEIASFFVNPEPELDDRAPKDLLDDRSRGEVLTAARRAIARLFD